MMSMESIDGLRFTCIGVGYVYFEHEWSKHEWRDHWMRHCSGVEHELGVDIMILQCFWYLTN